MSRYETRSPSFITQLLKEEEEKPKFKRRKTLKAPLEDKKLKPNTGVAMSKVSWEFYITLWI